MADAMEIVPNKGMPTLPSLRHVPPVQKTIDPGTGFQLVPGSTVFGTLCPTQDETMFCVVSMGGEVPPWPAAMIAETVLCFVLCPCPGGGSCPGRPAGGRARRNICSLSLPEESFKNLGYARLVVSLWWESWVVLCHANAPMAN